MAFKLAEAAVILCGVAYNGTEKETGHPRFNKVYMVDIFCAECSVFLGSVIDEWHRPVRLWLKYCIHMRIRGNSQAKMFFTFFVSAAWHGYYPLYFGAYLFYSVGTINFNFIYKMFLLHKSLRRPVFHVIQA